MFDLPPRIGRWTIDRLLGQGGMATVLLGVDDDVPEGALGHEAAIKWLHSASPRIRARFAREIRVMKAIDHPSIARVLEAGEAEGRPWMALAYVDGPDLAQYAQTLRKRPPAERVARVRDFAVDLCDALGTIHDAGLVHRDVKPANVLLGPDGRVVLTDFGVVAELDSEDPVTQSGTLVGTAAWAAPEQLGGGDVDARADQYGLGATLYLLLTGQRPIDTNEPGEILRRLVDGRIRAPSAIDPTIPADLETFVLRLMNRQPSDRFADMQAARAALGPARTVGRPLAGRQPAIDAIASALDEVAAGAGLLVAVRGAPLSGRGWLANVARSAGERRGVLVLTADDPRSLEAACARVNAREALLVLTAARDCPWRSPDRVIRLDPLSLADLRRSTHALAPDTPQLALAADQLHRWSGGNAGLFLALVEGCTHNGALVIGHTPPPVNADPYLEGLDLDALTVAGALAAVPGTLDLDLLGRIAQVPAEDALVELEERGIAARSQGNLWRLLPEALREPILARVPDGDALLDRAVASLPPDDTDDADGILAEAHTLDSAGRDEEARALLQRSPETLPRRLLLGRLCWRVGDLVGAATAFDRVLADAPGGLLRARAAIGAGATALHRGDLGVALDRFTQAVTEAGLPGSAGVARGHLVLACVNLAEARALAGDPQDALRAARRALDIAQAERDRALECLATRCLGRVQLDVGQYADATTTLADASALARATDMREERLVAHVLRAELLLRMSEREADPGAWKTAATAAQDRLLPLLSATGIGVDPEGWNALVRAVYARVVARLGDGRALAKWTTEAENLLQGVGVPGKVRVERALAAAWSEGPHATRAEGARRTAKVDATARLYGFGGLTHP